MTNKIFLKDIKEIGKILAEREKNKCMHKWKPCEDMGREEKHWIHECSKCKSLGRRIGRYEFNVSRLFALLKDAKFEVTEGIPDDFYFSHTADDPHKTDVIYIFGLSKEFSVVPTDDVVPLYVITVTTTENNNDAKKEEKE